MIKWLIGGLVLLLVAVGAVWASAGPGTLDWIDRRMTGGADYRHVADLPFGDQGLALDVWAPAAPATRPRPVLVFFHGGGWVHGSRQDYGFAARAFVDAGYVVVVPDYRKVPGVRFPSFVQDGAAALRWVRDNVARYGGDPARVAVAGHSAGAYNAVMLALDRRWLAAEGLPPGFIKAGVGLSGPYDFYPFDKQRSRDAMAGVAEPMMTQPVTFARADAPPLLLVTSSADTQVRPRNAGNLTLLLRDKGARAEFRDYQGLSHEAVVMALSRPFRGKAPVLRDSVAFLNQVMPTSR